MQRIIPKNTIYINKEYSNDYKHVHSRYPNESSSSSSSLNNQAPYSQLPNASSSSNSSTSAAVPPSSTSTGGNTSQDYYDHGGGGGGGYHRDQHHWPNNSSGGVPGSGAPYNSTPNYRGGPKPPYSSSNNPKPYRDGSYYINVTITVFLLNLMNVLSHLNRVV